MAGYKGSRLDTSALLWKLRLTMEQGPNGHAGKPSGAEHTNGGGAKHGEWYQYVFSPERPKEHIVDEFRNALMAGEPLDRTTKIHRGCIKLLLALTFETLTAQDSTIEAAGGGRPDRLSSRVLAFAQMCV